MHFPLGARGNNFDSQIKRIPFASNGVFCACTSRERANFVTCFVRITIININLGCAFFSFFIIDIYDTREAHRREII